MHPDERRISIGLGVIHSCPQRFLPGLILADASMATRQGHCSLLINPMNWN
jgi:hypothetical protein